MVNHTNITSVKINVWGYMTYGHQARIFMVSDRLEHEEYIECLRNNLLHSPIDMSSHVFMQDNCGIHKTVEVLEFFQSENWRVLNHPPISPDANPMENIWMLVQRKLNHFLVTNFVNTPRELFRVVKRFVREISVENINNLVKSMPYRLAEIRMKSGGHTKY